MHDGPHVDSLHGTTVDTCRTLLAEAVQQQTHGHTIVLSDSVQQHIVNLQHCIPHLSGWRLSPTLDMPYVDASDMAVPMPQTVDREPVADGSQHIGTSHLSFRQAARVTRTLTTAVKSMRPVKHTLFKASSGRNTVDEADLEMATVIEVTVRCAQVAFCRCFSQCTRRLDEHCTYHTVDFSCSPNASATCKSTTNHHDSESASIAFPPACTWHCQNLLPVPTG